MSRSYAATDTAAAWSSRAASNAHDRTMRSHWCPVICESSARARTAACSHRARCRPASPRDCPRMSRRAL
eukprot:4425531-Alexandrium_andersonii.AAC.1